jgi:allophanate hydrolase
MSGLEVLAIGPGATLQDAGRPGWRASGVAQGGAVDPFALAEGAALLGQGAECAALELALGGARLRAPAPLAVALTGAERPLRIGGRAARWNASHALDAGDVLELGPSRHGVFSYLHVAGGFDGPRILGSRAAHLAAGLGRAVNAGETLALADDHAASGAPAGRAIPPLPRGEGPLRLLPGPQTELFDEATLKRFCATTFTRDARGNRQGVLLTSGEAPFAAGGQLSLLSEPVVPGDVQLTGEGAPFVLGPECQTMGGYPRIGTLLPADLVRVYQAPPGTRLRFAFVGAGDARAEAHALAAALAGLAERVRPAAAGGWGAAGSPSTAELLGARLVDGFTTGLPETGPDTGEDGGGRA